MKEILEDLNESQKQAVLYNDGPALVIAGAGSGKTRVLTYKIAYLLQQGYQPYNIIALTFTNKAAREMKERIARLVGGSAASRLWMGTFHSIFLRILRVHADLLGFTKDLTIYDSSDSRSLIKAIIKERGLDDKVYKPATVQAVISNAKNALITPQAYAANGEIVAADVQSKRPEIKDIYRTYWNRCFTAGAMDFDDLLLYTNILFRDFPEVLARYRELFQYILVDEYQDTNFAQHLIVRQLAKGNNKLCVVGDDAQSIYSFRGAQIRNILNIRNEYPDCRIFKLEQNYRSTQTIVNAANSLIQKNKEQIHKKVYSENEEGDKLAVLNAYSDFEEGYLVAGKITEMRMKYRCPFSDFAVLYRTNAQSRIFEEALRKRNIPYRIYGGLSFYQRKEIKDIIAYFRMAVNPSDEEALKRIINYPARGIGDTTVGKIQQCANVQNSSMWQVLVDPVGSGLSVNSGTANKLSTFKELIVGFHALVSEKNVLELAEQIVKQSGILTEVYADRSTENLSRQENIQELMNGIREFCLSRQEEGRDDILLTDFLSEVSLATDQDNTDGEDADQVTLMTVHASKGLEFNHVFVVGLEEDLFPSAMSKGSEQEVEEERRLFYVAITRARQNCILSYASTRYRNGQTTALPPSRFLKDIDPVYLSLPVDASLSEQVNRRAQAFAARSVAGWGEKRRESVSVPDTEPVWKQPATRGRLLKIDTLQFTSSPSHTPSDEGPSVGTRIQHDRFGKGTVTQSEGAGDNRKITVEFDHVGKKQLLLKFAKFTIIS
ncbi:MAG TPA: exodeoxyribonuclease V subunit gamma [Candidatus Gallibacteroides avistercoris]|uniref:DNA 3'-5' helicase n=1 Tax=Candidatus Gallibacteroides avistercoris TaxID=2840833 RepID=A0A9D1SC47_9BACT|nr:exodeoxyribonuclease V subunit gamma [Candidatus Gallibacteroides avistercoris]